MSCGLRLPGNNRITIIFYSFHKNLFWTYKSPTMACIMQGDLQRRKLKAKCSCAILVSLCSAVNGSLQHKTGHYWPCSHSQNSTIPPEDTKASYSVPHPEAVQHTPSTHLPYWLRSHSSWISVYLRQQPTSAAAEETHGGQFWSNISTGEYAF